MVNSAFCTIRGFFGTFMNVMIAKTCTTHTALCYNWPNITSEAHGIESFPVFAFVCGMHLFRVCLKKSVEEFFLKFLSRVEETQTLVRSYFCF